MKWIYLATEDELSEKVGIRLATEAGLEIGQCLRRNGFGYLKSRVENFCQMARQAPVFLITDLDRKQCASTLIEEWLGNHKKPENFLFRVAIREIESWILADQEALRKLLGKKGQIPHYPDELADPKSVILSLAQNAPKNIKEELIIKKGAISSQGVGYNSILGKWVSETWCPTRAAERSPSLQRTRQRLLELSERLKKP
ncbi:DUF4276 family protein [Pseudomonas chlororaphis]|uniref:DUF4276 family protein n=1 Tax=Pseudomonas chlororaphis TaxID=587753 RepID=UPI00209A7918|nr:DUF4276 family protein [Pseudomonas chlororaphis]MCO7573102.1 DUF4276 family protein [Pseudomonas chlororaphis]MCO7591539.1 DUF4276 family protein [Pseudomonas chlororaphis]